MVNSFADNKWTIVILESTLFVYQGQSNFFFISGESQNNLTGHIGGDSNLTKRGHAYAKMLGDYVEQLPHPRLKIWTSWLKRSIETANHINGVQERYFGLALLAIFVLHAVISLYAFLDGRH